MSRILTGEICVGLVTFLCNFCLREMSDCKTSAWLENGVIDHSIKEPHYFMVLAYIEQEDLWLCSPLSSKLGSHQKFLEAHLKHNYVDQWALGDSYFFERQFWKMTTNAICRSSNTDTSPQGQRRQYGFIYPGDVGQLLNFNTRNRNKFRVAPPI